MTKRIMKYSKTIVVFILLVINQLTHAERIKDIASVAGVRSNQLIGYGLVVGLNGTGDQTNQTAFTVQSFKSMLQEFGVAIPSNANIQLKNVAAVALHAELPAFAKPGMKIDVTISSLGNAKSLRGGSLLMSPLKGADNHVYALAQGSLVVSGFGVSGQDGSKITVNVPSVGHIPNGAMVERPAPTPFAHDNSIIFNLHRPDFTSAKRLSQVINKKFGSGTAHPLDGASVFVNSPHDIEARVNFVSLLENLRFKPGDAAAKIVINARTGTVVIGQHVRVLPAAVSHGNLTVTVTEAPFVSQPAPLSNGETRALPASKVEVEREDNRAFYLNPGVSLQDIVRAINGVGAAPSDMVAILEALKEVGALHADMVVI